MAPYSASHSMFSSRVVELELLLKEFGLGFDELKLYSSSYIYKLEFVSITLDNLIRQ